MLALIQEQIPNPRGDFWGEGGVLNQVEFDQPLFPQDLAFIGFLLHFRT